MGKQAELAFAYDMEIKITSLSAEVIELKY